MIHILPTDKPSRLSKQLDNPLVLYKQFIENRKFGKWSINQNIYITSDEEIKEGDWFLDDNNQISRSYRLSHVQFSNPKKIILTTDQDLIKDGIQAIDDDFLEWFVKNPSCEEVEVEPLMAGFIDDEPSYYENMYEIIIPKEEPKQETLEEAAEKYPYRYASYGSQRKAFTDGAKWNQERSYSEEEVVNILMKVYEDIRKRKIPNPVVLAEWFNKFKKK